VRACLNRRRIEPAGQRAPPGCAVLRSQCSVRSRVLQQQDSTRSKPRYAELIARLKDVREHLRWNPAAGRPARFLQARSAQGRAMAARAKALAAAHGVSELRELVVKPYVLLYAHGTDRVVLLALRHERELAFQVG
jgi:hypothetical protein